MRAESRNLLSETTNRTSARRAPQKKKLLKTSPVQEEQEIETEEIVDLSIDLADTWVLVKAVVQQQQLGAKQFLAAPTFNTPQPHVASSSLVSYCSVMQPVQFGKYRKPKKSINFLLVL